MGDKSENSIGENEGIKEESLLSPWPLDIVDRLSAADFVRAARMLREGQRILLGFGSLPRAHLEPEPIAKSKRSL